MAAISKSLNDFLSGPKVARVARMRFGSVLLRHSPKLLHFRTEKKITVRGGSIEDRIARCQNLAQTYQDLIRQTQIPGAPLLALLGPDAQS